jgi:TonB family protein
MSDSWRDSEGQVIDGQFPLVKYKAATDHSVVFSTLRGKDKNEKAAIKFIQADASNADDQLARWRHVAQLSHPNLIKVYESGRCQLAGLDLLYVVMEQTQENLGEFLPQRALSAVETHDMLEPFVDALSYLHGKGFAHGRIKPGNILAIDDQLKLSSDSICREADMQIGTGKPDIYLAPETNGRATKAGDSWGLGVTIVESLTQRPPEETAGDPGFPDSLPEPFLDIARNTLRRDAKSRWNIADISNRLNTKAAAEPVKAVAVVAAPTPTPTSAASAAAAKPAPASAPAAIAVAEPPKSTPSKSAGSLAAAASAGTATAVAVAPAPVEPKAVPLAKPTKSIDPLSVPLSKVEPHFDAGKSSSKGWYIAIILLIAFAAGAWYTVPEVREFTQKVISNSPATEPSQPAQSASPAPASSQPAAEPTPPPADSSKPDTTPAAKPAAPAPAPTHGGIDGPPQVSSTQPPASATPASTPASIRTPLKKDAALSPAATTSQTLAASTVAPLPAISRTAAVAPTSLPAGPVTQGAPLNQVMPEISSRARSTIHGTVRVILKVRVSASGAVETATPASSPSRFFSDAAVQAAKQWDFTPAKISGQPVRSEWLVQFDFTPTGTKVLPSQTKP